MAAPVVVVGVDGSERSVSALAAAVRLADATGGRIIAIHVVRAYTLATTGPASAAGALAVTNDEITDRCHMDCELVLAGTDVSWSFEVRHGDPANELTRAAADHDAVCITIGRNPQRRFTFGSGSTMQRLVHRSDRPVLIVPSRS